MGIWIRKQAETVQGAHTPVHWRVRRKPCLQSMDMGCQILKALLNCVKPWKGTKQGKVRCPDMGRHINPARAGFQHYFQQIPTRNPQNGTAVWMNITNQLQPSCQRLRCIHLRQNKKAVHLSHPLPLFINGADFSGHHETGTLIWHAAFLDPVFLFQNIQTVLSRFQLFCQFYPPCRMGEVSCPDNINSLLSRP